MNDFAVQFTLTVEKIEGQQSPRIEVDDPNHLELPRRMGGPDIQDVISDWDIKQNINCYEKVEALESGKYDCLMAGTWDFEISYDYEGGKDAELILEIKYFVSQPALEENNDETDC